MKFKSFDRNALRTLRPVINEALQKVGDRYGIKFEFNNMRFDSESFSTKLNVTIAGAKPVIPAFVPTMKLGKALPPIGHTFTTGSASYKVTGYKMNRPKYPICAEQIGTDRKFKFTIEQVTSA